MRSYTKNRLVRTLSPSINLFRAAAFSRQMSLFFKYHINGLLQGLWVSIVYAGGDDVFLVGAWNHTLQAALRIQKAPAQLHLQGADHQRGHRNVQRTLFHPRRSQQTAALEELLISADADALRISDAMPWRGESFYLAQARSPHPHPLPSFPPLSARRSKSLPGSRSPNSTATPPACTAAPTRWTSWTRALARPTSRPRPA